MAAVFQATLLNAYFLWISLSVSNEQYDDMASDNALALISPCLLTHKYTTRPVLDELML